MSSTRERSSEETFMCSICLEVFSEPVTIPCGHNFCKRCINKVWNTAGPCTCPLCNEVFSSRPELKVNTLLREVVSERKQDKNESRSIEEKFDSAEVSCDLCSEPKLKALKSCLVCLSSFCETHLQPHLTVSVLKKHQLMEPVENLEDRMCPDHQHPLQLFCDTDEKLVCMMCIPEHQNHKFVCLQEAYESRKSSLLHTQTHTQLMVEQRRLKLQEIQRCVELSDTEVDRERAEGLQVFTALIQSVQRRQELFLEELQEKQKLTHKRAQDLVQQLEQEICELKKSSTEAEQISRSQDPLYFLQHCPALTPPAGLKELSRVCFESEKCEGNVAQSLTELEKSLSEEIKQMLKPHYGAELRKIQKFAVDVTLDPDTAHPNLVLSKDLKQVHHTDVKKSLPDSPLRFTRYSIVLGKQSFSSGRFYFEVQVKEKTNWELGVAQESVDRKGECTAIPQNGYWCICLNNTDEYKACTDPFVPLSPAQAPQKVEMSSTSERSSEETFMCSICLEVFSEPVSTPCGHNFCKHCISEAWNTAGPCTCPLCKEVFSSRPELKVNTLLREVVSERKQDKNESRSMEEKFDFAEVQCDLCSEPKLKALKSCLVCLSSFCETHLQPHLTVSVLKKHQLLEPVQNLEDRMCPEHQRPLELFCDTDETLVCIMCIPLEHQNHKFVSLQEACERRKSSLLHTQTHTQLMVEQRRLKLQEIQRCVELSDTEVDRERAEGLQVFTALIESVQRRQELFLEELQEKQKLTHKRAQDLVQQLEQEICELEKSITEAEQISRSQDPLYFLQHCPALTPPAGLKELSSVCFESEKCEGSVAQSLMELQKSLSEEIKQMLKPHYEAELRKVQKFAVDVTLDPDTAHPNLVLSHDLKQVHHTDVKKSLPDSPLRFTYYTIVLGKQSFSSGRSYFEVQVKGKTAWELGVAQESVDRKGKIPPFPQNGYWCLWLSNTDGYKACTDPRVRLSPQRAPQKVGVFVDYDQGLVSFYDADSADLLFSFTGFCFRGKLFPYFCTYNNDKGLNSAPMVITAVETDSEAK
ncbi:hypothetical protein WMY93_003286 [Mugilogobius chulae]|uniref:Uncharacterized protein n=1 Tax=Mugilogobius chulae TaxID=88201 RepID=A0AAW0PXT8_9GOBI